MKQSECLLVDKYKKVRRIIGPFSMITKKKLMANKINISSTYIQRATLHCLLLSTDLYINKLSLTNIL